MHRVAQQDDAEGAGQHQGGAGEEHRPRRGVRQVGSGAGGIGKRGGGRAGQCRLQRGDHLSAAPPGRPGSVHADPRRAPDAISRRDRSVSAGRSAAAGHLTFLGRADPVAESRRTTGAGPPRRPSRPGWWRAPTPTCCGRRPASSPPGQLLRAALVVDEQLRLGVDGVLPIHEGESNNFDSVIASVGQASTHMSQWMQRRKSISYTKPYRSPGDTGASGGLSAPARRCTGPGTRPRHIAANALLHAVFVPVEDMAPVEALGLRTLLLRVQGRDLGLERQLSGDDEAFEEVQELMAMPSRHPRCPGSAGRHEPPPLGGAMAHVDGPEQHDEEHHAGPEATSPHP